MSTRTFQPTDPEAAPFEELRLQNMKKPISPTEAALRTDGVITDTRPTPPPARSDEEKE